MQLKRSFFLVLTSTLLLSLTMWAQSSLWKSLLNEADSLETGAQDSIAAITCDSAYNVAAAASEPDTVLASIAEKAGDLYYSSNDFSKAIERYRQAQTIRERLSSYDQLPRGRLLHRIGRAFLRLGEQDSAEVFLLQSLDLLVDSSYDCRLARAAALYTLSRRYEMWARFSEAKPLLKESYDLHVSLKNQNTDDFMATCAQLGTVCIYTGEYAEAEFYLSALLDVAEEHPPHEMSIYAAGLHRMGLIRDRLADYTGALEYFTRAWQVYRELLEPNDPALAAEQRTIGLAHWALGDSEAAEEWLQHAVATYELGPKKYLIANCMRDLARVAIQRQDFAQAEAFFDSALSIQARTLPEDHPALAQTLEPLAGFYLEHGQPEKAEPLFKRSLEIERSYWGARHVNVAFTLYELGECRRFAGNVQQALDYHLQAFDIRYEHLARNSATMLEPDALRLARFMRNSYDACLSCLVDSGLEDPDEIASTLPVILAGKGQISDQIFERHKSLQQGSEPELTTRLLEYREAVSALSNIYFSTDGGAAQAADSLARRVKHLERELAAFNPDLGIASTYTELSARTLAQFLPQNAILIEYVRFNYLSPGSYDGEPHYLSLTIARDQPAILTDLGAAAPVDSLVSQHLLAMDSAASSWPQVTDQQNQDIHRIGHQLYQLLCKPSAAELATANSVLIAPDATLNLLSFASLLDDSDKYLIESHPLHYLAAARDLQRLATTPTCGGGLLAVGSPDFDADPQTRLSESASSQEEESQEGMQLAASRVYLNPRGGQPATPLPYTGREVRSVAKEWLDEVGPNVTLLTGAAASEENFKSLAPGKACLHLATHGFFSTSDSAQVISTVHSSAAAVGTGLESPLLQSGLLLAGANVGSSSDRSLEDGILTAYEIASLDLHDACWVVLSACETGLGELQSGEGVYGVRRAFQIAGARTVISTLWPVPDKETVALMQRLYSCTGISLAESMQQACLSRLAELRAAGRPDYPYVWAAFVGLGDWRSSPGGR